MTANIFLLVFLLGICLLFILILNGFVNSRVKNKATLTAAPLSIDILKATLFASCGLLISEMYNPAQILTRVLSIDHSGIVWIFWELGYLLVFGIVAFVGIAVVFWLTVLFLSIQKKGSSIFEAVAANSYGSLLLFVGIYLSLVLVFKSTLGYFLSEIIPTPFISAYY